MEHSQDGDSEVTKLRLIVAEFSGTMTQVITSLTSSVAAIQLNITSDQQKLHSIMVENAIEKQRLTDVIEDVQVLKTKSESFTNRVITNVLMPLISIAAVVVAVVTVLYK